MACLNNPMFLVGERMVAQKYSMPHATCLMEVGNPKFFQCLLISSSLCMNGLANLGLQVILKKLSGDQDLSLILFLFSFYQSFPRGFVSSTSLLSFVFYFFMVFSYVLFSVWYSFLVTCLNNHIFFGRCKDGGFPIFHATHLLEEGNPKSIECLLTYSLCMSEVVNLALQVI